MEERRKHGAISAWDLTPMECAEALWVDVTGRACTAAMASVSAEKEEKCIQ